MGRITLLLFSWFCLISATYGMDCSYGTSDSILEKIVRTCPVPIIGRSDLSYCCDDGCCNLIRYLFTGKRLVIIIVASVVLFLLGCCPCCYNYRRGAVQGTPSTIHIIQMPNAHPSNNGYTALV